MASHDERSSQAPREPALADTGELTPHPRYDESLQGDAFEVMRKYQVVTMPPNARLKLMQMKLPKTPDALLQDTLPPNGAVAAPAAPDAGVADDAEKDFFDDSRSQETVLVPRVVRSRRTNGLLVALVLGSLLALAVATSVWLARASGNVSTVTPAESPKRPFGNASAAPMIGSPASIPSAASPLPEPTPSTVQEPLVRPARPATEVKRSQPRSQHSDGSQPPPTPPSRGKQPWIDGL